MPRSPRPIWPGSKPSPGKAAIPHKVASVASFFVSRIDTLVDEALDERIAGAPIRRRSARLEALKGKVAIANAKLAYQRYSEIYSGRALAARWRSRARRRSACSGPAPAPRTRPIATCSMSTS